MDKSCANGVEFCLESEAANGFRDLSSDGVRTKACKADVIDVTGFAKQANPRLPYMLVQQQSNSNNRQYQYPIFLLSIWAN